MGGEYYSGVYCSVVRRRGLQHLLLLALSLLCLLRSSQEGGG